MFTLKRLGASIESYTNEPWLDEPIVFVGPKGERFGINQYRLIVPAYAPHYIECQLCPIKSEDKTSSVAGEAEEVPEARQ